MNNHPSPTTRSAWTTRSTLVLFGFLALTSQLPAVVDIYSNVVFRLLYIPAYLVSLLVYEGLGIEHVTYALDAQVLGAQPYLWDSGQVVTYYLFAVSVIWLGQRFKHFGRREPPRTPTNGK